MQVEKIFSELEGFIIYDPQCLANYISENNIFNQDLLSYFMESEDGDFVIQNGIIVPIMGVEPNYYTFEINNDLENYAVIKESDGWILKVVSKQINIIGIGYLANVSTLNKQKSLSFAISNGWYKVSIATYIDVFSSKSFVLKLQKVLTKPNYEGNMETNNDW
ncbi:hypothetical protein CAPN006_21810 [Capnocytophaga canimorsus]|uniref:Uncharacterized protein n=1 Tax=Capnocytophaga canis TaxID=1848903 RepID=A0A3A1YC24_9FLAO|nr:MULTISPECIES: hypothetical protein [Capnocytophaga]RIY34926.1 hypothetical protein CKY20_11595 [Capnocytophaga canis]GIM57789.1 hypothetical protein CAPN006_21810 [Capnocytophaga canimorsus]